MKIGDQSRLKDVYAHPVGRDVIDKLLLQLNKSRRLITNPLVGNLKMKTIRRLAEKKTGPDFWNTVYELLNSEKDLPNKDNPRPSKTWWKQAVFYQIYPRSFADSNGDGIGDLRGIIEKLDYLQDLGVDALWLSPIYDSPNDDNGYDIRNYRAIMDEMGTMEDFDELLAACHARGMRLIMDLVVNHTSDEHRWFKAALEDPDGPYGDYYYFVDGEEGKLPNNWVSFFSGPAWNWYPEKKKYALHLFSKKQMDLNWENPDVRREIYDMVRWWHEKGVDGFRLDVINYISKKPGLPDGNELIGELMQFYGIEQYYYGPRLHEFLRELRAEAFEPYEAFSVGETPGVGIEMGRLLTGQDRHELDLIFGFDQLENPGEVRFNDYRYDLNYLKRYYMDYQTRIGSNDWLAVFWENHDNPRMVSKIEPELRHRAVLAKLLQTIQLSMKGTVFMFQGQELGAANHPFSNISQLRDVESLNYYQELLEGGMSKDKAWAKILAGSRDQARVPMRWTEEKGGGFTSGTAWLEAPDEDSGWSAAAQAEKEDSVLNYCKALIRLRRAHEALRLGEIEFLAPQKKDYMAYLRKGEKETLFCEFNLSPEALKAPSNLKQFRKERLISNCPENEGKSAWLEPYEGRIYKL